MWAQESFRIAQNSTYPYILTTSHLNDQYNAQTYEICRKRITLAGYRLANYMVDIYSKAVREEKKNLMGSVLRQERRNRPPIVERSLKELKKMLAEDSWQGFRESPLRTMREVLNIRT